MRRQDQWLLLADRLEMSRVLVVAVCAFLNMRRPLAWIARELGVSLENVVRVSDAARPLLRQSRRINQPFGDRVCFYCGTDADLTRDHVEPKSKGGSHSVTNLVWACRSCNSAKGNRTPQEWLG